MIRRNTKKPEVKQDCFFCKEKVEPDFLKHEILERFISERGKIHSRARSGLCAKHQRRLTTEIKRARFLAFLPYVSRVD